MKRKIIFLNQYAGVLFRELGEDLAIEFGPCDLLTGHTEEIDDPLHPNLHVVSCPNQRTNNAFERILSWSHYCFSVFLHLWLNRKTPLLFIVSNPPILPWLGYLVRKLWGQCYVILIYDLYPNMMVQFADLPENGWVARLWRFLNRISFENAEVVFTIGEYMAREIDKMYHAEKTTHGQTAIIPNWSDTRRILPITKLQNPFVLENGLIDKFTVIYSGTIGLKHNVRMMVQALSSFKEEPYIHFLFIGRGDGYKEIEEIIHKEQFNNVTLMPFLPEREIQFSLPAGDIAVISLDRGGEGVYVPSKIYYALAAGVALLAICSDHNELADLIREHKCGLVVPPDDQQAFNQAIRFFYEDREFLKICQGNSRRVAQVYFDRKVCTQSYIQILKKFVG